MTTGFSRRGFGAAVAGALGGGIIAAGHTRAANIQEGKIAMSGKSRSIIDVHSHSMLSSWVAALRARDPQGRAIIEGLAVPEWSPAAAIRVMDENGIGTMVLSNPIGTKGFAPAEAIPLARRMNDEMAKIVADAPTRFGAFGVLPLCDVEASLRELAYVLDVLKLDGVCLQTNTDGVYVGDDRFEPLIAELDRRRAVAFVHPVAPVFQAQTGLPINPAMLEFMFDITRAVASLILSGRRKRYPNFEYIVTHGGGTLPYLAQRIASMSMPRTSGYDAGIDAADVRAGLASLHYDLTASTNDTVLEALTKIVPVEQILLGFDYPMRSASLIAPGFAELKSSRVLGPQALDQIFHANPIALLPGVAARIRADA